jgi:diguanylate cyclase (GGDEF)-like protein
MRREAQTELRALRARIAELTDEAANNERLFRKSLERELDLLKAQTPVELFDAICRGLAQSYGLDVVTLVLRDRDHEMRHLLLADRVRLEHHPGLIFTDVVPAVLARPWLGPYVAADHNWLFPGSSGLGSIALIPLLRQQGLEGSVNFGSRDPQRFTRHLATDFLEQLGAIAAFAVENTMNRARLLRSGITDFLTGWHNRRYLHERLREELARARRQGTNLACLIVDVDHFKTVNDRHGHLIGDLVLRETAQRIEAQVRGSDASARFGGDEFVVLVPEASDAQVVTLAERIRSGVAASTVTPPGEEPVRITVSIGGASVRPSDYALDARPLAEALLESADSALYRAKEAGRNRVEFATNTAR